MMSFFRAFAIIVLAWHIRFAAEGEMSWHLFFNISKSCRTGRYYRSKSASRVLKIPDSVEDKSRVIALLLENNTVLCSYAGWPELER